MRRVTRNGVIAVAAASGAMAVTGPVYAASGADGTAAGSAGVISGNTVQLPVHIPVNGCGNTVNVVGLLNPAAGNRCADDGADGDMAETPDTSAMDGGAATNGVVATGGGATASGGGMDSPGVLSGNGVHVPVHVPVNVSGNSVSVIGVGGAAVGDESVNTSGNRPERPAPTQPPLAYPVPQAAPPAPQPHFTAELARTGADQTLSAVAGSAALIVGGAAVYRRFRPHATR